MKTLGGRKNGQKNSQNRRNVPLKCDQTGGLVTKKIEIK